MMRASLLVLRTRSCAGVWAPHNTALAASTMLAGSHLVTAAPTHAAPPAALYMSQRAVFTTSPFLRKDVRKGDRGDARRLTFEERAERRMGKTREQKESKEQMIQEAETLVHEDFPDELESIYAVAFEKAQVSAMKVLNMAKCLELLEIEMPGGHQVILTKVAQVVKTSNTTIEITPNNNTFASPVLQRVSRFDSALQVSKEGQKVVIAIPPMTTARRDKTAHEIKSLITHFRQRVKQSRTNVGKVLQDSGIDEGMISELTQQLDSTVTSFTEEKAAELELLSEEVMSMGIEESDASVV